MGQQHPKQPSKSKLGRYLTGLCSNEASKAEVVKLEPQNCATGLTEAPKKKRMTLMMDRVLLKLTRKNINAKKSHSSSYYTYQIQKHLASRLKGMNVVEFQGKFSDSLINSVPQGIQIQRPSQYISFNSEDSVTKYQRSTTL